MRYEFGDSGRDGEVVALGWQPGAVDARSCGDGLEEAVDLVRERLIELGYGCCHQ
jgi:hypothetical protein